MSVILTYPDIAVPVGLLATNFNLVILFRLVNPNDFAVTVKIEGGGNTSTASVGANSVTNVAHTIQLSKPFGVDYQRIELNFDVSVYDSSNNLLKSYSIPVNIHLVDEVVANSLSRVTIYKKASDLSLKGTGSVCSDSIDWYITGSSSIRCKCCSSVLGPIGFDVDLTNKTMAFVLFYALVNNTGGRITVMSDSTTFEFPDSVLPRNKPLAFGFSLQDFIGRKARIIFATQDTYFDQIIVYTA